MPGISESPHGACLSCPARRTAYPSISATMGKWQKLYLPRVNGDELDILPYSPESLHKGAFSILEPDGNECTDVDTLDLIIVPAVAFDRRGNRLGRGKGFYDRLLQKAKCPKSALPTISTAGRNTGRTPRHPDGQNNYRTGHPINQ